MQVRFGELLALTGEKRSTLNYYVRLGLLPYTRADNGYRYFAAIDCYRRVTLIRLLLRAPFRYPLDVIREIFATQGIETLWSQQEQSLQALRLYLVQQGF
ncbi:MAG: MerR family transcriptional regulator [Candidatus Tectomicrobia bacterium]|nr:MerR family transcriptional regulator [Candidatus Tectomicrobia bacterium]